MVSDQQKDILGHKKKHHWCTSLDISSVKSQVCNGECPHGGQCDITWDHKSIFVMFAGLSFQSIEFIYYY